jgi:gamma-glutamyl hercynylcysteine S-oxide synthase
MNQHYIAGPSKGQDRAAWLASVREYRLHARQGLSPQNATQPAEAHPLDRSIYDRPDLQWMARNFACHFTFMYDQALYGPLSKRYTIDAFLDEGVREFGGYDSIVLWQGYPRLGVDDRNQFDMYRDMPGGLKGLRALIGRCHERSVKVFIDYNPWDAGTRREDKSDEQALADLVGAIEADGIFLDTMIAGSPELRRRVDQARPGVAFVPEGHPAIEQLAICSGSWAQSLSDSYPPGMLHLKWIEPRHMQFQIKRWDTDHAGEIEAAFFNGSGMMIWENIFGVYNPWPVLDRSAWRQASAVLRYFAQAFTSDEWDPFYPTLVEGLYAHRWPGEGYSLFTLVNRGQPLQKAELLEISAGRDLEFFDLWKGTSLHTSRAGTGTRIIGNVERLGCILAIEKAKITPELHKLLDSQGRQAEKMPPGDTRNTARSVVEAEPVKQTRLAPRDAVPPGMVLVPGAKMRVQIRHMRRECGCYPDPSTPKEKWNDFLRGHPHDEILNHDYSVEVKDIFIDEAEVSNADFKRFLDATGYRARYPESFLKHWPDGRIPEALADHPVVYVDPDDARAYARWAGKRLPTEPEWQLAAQGTDGRAWPWGNEFDAARCNSSGKGTMPVRSLPDGRSPSGCYHMSGNVWEWTESARDDGHTRFVMIRGGSWFDAKGSIWYVRGGPQPCNHHAKFIRMWPGLDRCATIGFRCVVDVQE